MGNTPNDDNTRQLQQAKMIFYVATPIAGILACFFGVKGLIEHRIYIPGRYNTSGMEFTGWVGVLVSGFLVAFGLIFIGCTLWQLVLNFSKQK